MDTWSCRETERGGGRGAGGGRPEAGGGDEREGAAIFTTSHDLPDYVL